MGPWVLCKQLKDTQTINGKIRTGEMFGGLPPKKPILNKGEENAAMQKIVILQLIFFYVTKNIRHQRMTT